MCRKSGSGPRTVEASGSPAAEYCVLGRVPGVTTGAGHSRQLAERIPRTTRGTDQVWVRRAPVADPIPTTTLQKCVRSIPAPVSVRLFLIRSTLLGVSQYP